MSDTDATSGGVCPERQSREGVRRSALASWRPSAQLTPVERYGRFEILGRIGRGGMAEILLARERALPGTTRHLVIKRVLPEIADCDEMLRMFLDEARVVMGLSHPNLCQIYEVGEQDGTWFIAMEWVNGTTLHHLIKRAVSLGDIDYPVIARIASQCAEALHHAHTARDAEGRPLELVHRDVSPHNVMVAFDGRVKLLDFGIAKSATSTHRTEAGVVKGKVCYMAPEQWLSGPLDARTDVFALGACLYEAVTGTVVFKRDTQAEVMKAILEEDATPLAQVAPAVPAALADIAHRALALAPPDRFQSAREMSEALDRYLAALAEPVSAARVADYARRLFPSEVALGPLLERPVRGAQLERESLMLPPVPEALLAQVKPPSGQRRAALPPPLHPGLPRIPAPPPLPAPCTPVGTPSRPPSGFPCEVDLDSTEVDTVFGFGPSLAAHDEAAPDTKRGVSTFSDAPTRPLPGLEDEEPQRSRPQPRPAARTVSMHAARRVHRLAVGVVSAAAMVLACVIAPQLWNQPASPATAATSAPAVGAASRAPEAPVAPAVLREEAPLAPRLKPPEAAVQTASEAAPEGWLSIDTQPWSTVYLGNRVLGTTPLAHVAVPAGTLTLKLVDGQGRVHMRRLARSSHPVRSVVFDLSSDR